MKWKKRAGGSHLAHSQSRIIVHSFAAHKLQPPLIGCHAQIRFFLNSSLLSETGSKRSRWNFRSSFEVQEKRNFWANNKIKSKEIDLKKSNFYVTAYRARLCFTKQRCGQHMHTINYFIRFCFYFFFGCLFNCLKCESMISIRCK